jgi:hypothetical protein
MSKDIRDNDPALHALYLSTNITFELNDLFQPFTVLSTNSQLPGYSHQIFPRLKDLLKRFWIMTAANPLSEEHSKAQNAALNEKLQRDLNKVGLKYQPVTCTSADGKWTEQSFAVARQDTLKSQAVENLIIALAGKYLQNSVFSFSGNTMKILPVLRPDITGKANYFVYEPASRY